MKIPNGYEGHVAHRDRWSLARHRTASPIAARRVPPSASRDHPFAAPANTRILAITCCPGFFELHASLHQHGAGGAGTPGATQRTWTACCIAASDGRSGWLLRNDVVTNAPVLPACMCDADGARQARLQTWKTCYPDFLCDSDENCGQWEAPILQKSGICH
ncbi:hypothetical protein [Burkholderia territorii]|uniref:hypothetical protein n=1 Tax=Burkholderia territorii TaxID=1503055 RepID=UPI000A7FBACC|nr:hypothetical protein [Burkholderia territorii]